MAKKEIKKQIEGSNYERKLSLNNNAIDEKNRTISFIFISKDNEGKRYSPWENEKYIEQLDVKGAKFERLKTFFKDHTNSASSAIGKVRNVRIENDELKGDVVFGNDEDANKIFRKYLDGILTDVSIGYTVNSAKIEERSEEPDIVTVTDYEIYELSAVGIGFDKGAIVGREVEKKRGEYFMNEKLKKELEQLRSAVDELTSEQKTRKAELEKLDKENQIKANEKRSLNDKDETRAKDILNKERQRIAEINSMVEGNVLNQIRANTFIEDGSSLEQVRKAIVNKKIENSQTIKVIGQPDVENMNRAISDAMAIRCGISIDKPHKNVDMFRNASLLDVAKYSLNYNGYDRVDLAQRAMSSSDFVMLLGNVANRVVASSFEEQEGTYKLWTTNVDLPDFRLRNEVGLSNQNGRLRKVGEKQEKKNIEFSEFSESWKLDSYGEKFFLSREMIINDDLGVFTGIVNEFGRMSKRTANGLVYDLLQSKNDFKDYKMKDTNPIFDTKHNNVTTTGSVLSTTSLTQGRTAIRRQKEGEIALNINPKFLLVSPENETIAKQLLTSEADITKNNSGIANPHKNGFNLIVDAELDAKPWYLLAPRKTIKTGTLQGTNGMPIVKETQQGLSGTEFECVFDFGLVVEDYRSLYKNKGV